MEKVKKCYLCEAKLDKDIIGLNKKLIHRQIERMMCLTCMSAHFETTEDELNEMIERLKGQGCTLFG